MLNQLANAILSGDCNNAIKIMKEASKVYPIEDIINNGILAAWSMFSEFYEKDPVNALKNWDLIYITTIKVLKIIEGTIDEKKPSIIVATIEGEGHILMKEIIAAYLRSLGFKVYSPKGGINIDKLSNLDSSIKILVLSCIQDDTEENLKKLIKEVKKLLPDIKIIAGGPIAHRIGADYVVSNILELKNILLNIK
ncbi:MAG: cobalamin B12-binding domain-containing protein [Candidatus Methanomethylicaceae archaeon]|nr:cobalamin B12-binding domain-containing protein [Candidatus Verstraetearchaeota archaeon]